MFFLLGGRKGIATDENRIRARFGGKVRNKETSCLIRPFENSTNLGS